MRCLIVAAGQGTRLREKGGLKPLIPLRGMPLIGHVIARGRSAGVTGFVVVSGYRGEELRSALDGIARAEGVAVTHVVNEDWRRANGVSLLAAKAAFDEPFLLTMCDHLIDPEILRRLAAAPIEPDTVTLAVDFDIENPLNDPDDVTPRAVRRRPDPADRQVDRRLQRDRHRRLSLHAGHVRGARAKPGRW